MFGYLACLVLVIAVVLVVTGGRPFRLRTVPAGAALVVKLALGIALVVIAVLQWRRSRQAGQDCRRRGLSLGWWVRAAHWLEETSVELPGSIGS